MLPASSAGQMLNNSENFEVEVEQSAETSIIKMEGLSADDDPNVAEVNNHWWWNVFIRNLEALECKTLPW